MPGSLQTRLLAAVGLVAVSALVAVALAGRQSARRELLTFVDLEQRSAGGTARLLVEAIAARLEGPLDPAAIPSLERGLPSGCALLLVSDEGWLVAASPRASERFQGLSARRSGGELRIEGRGRDGDLLELVLRGGGTPVRLAGGGGGSLIPLLLPDERQGRNAAAALGALDQRLIWATAAASALALLLTWALARHILLPVRELQRAARELEGGRLDRRVPAGGPRELADLAHAFNAMAAELERQERLRRDMVSDVAHELRAPLTAMLCRLETVADGLDRDPAATLAGFHGDVAHLTRLVEDLQELALAEAGQLRLERERTQVLDAARSALRAAGLEADPRVRLEVDPALAVCADPVRLRQVLANLLSNAGRHAPPEGTVTVSAARDGPDVRVEVRDDGCGLTGDELVRVFERFYRTDPARQRATGGSGLGLAIVKGLVTAQGGLVFARGAPGGGAVFGFTLPWMA